MNQEILNRVGWMLENHSAVKVSIFKGEVSNFQLRFNSETGTASAFGSLKCVKKWTTQAGKERSETYYANFGAFGDVATSLDFQEGDEVVILTESSRRKGKDDKWYDNNTIILFEKLS